MSLGLPEIGTGSNYFSQYDSDITGLLSRIYDNNSNVILAKDVRDPIWTLWNRIQQVASQSLTQSSFYTLGTPSTISVGGISEGSTFSNATLNQLFDTLLLPYVSPVIDIFSSSVAEIQFGNPAPSTLSYSINVGSVALQSVNFVGPWLPIASNTPTGLDPDTGTKAVNLTYSTTVAITQTNRFTMSVVTTDLLSFTSSVDVTFKHKRYYGKLTIPGGFTASDPASVLSVASYLTDNIIKGLSFSELSTNVNFSQGVDFNNEYFIFAAPTIFGFNYPVGFYVDNIFTQDFTKIRSNSTFINDYSYSAPYDVYISNNIFYDPALISTIPLPQGYLTNNFNNVINSVIIGDQGPTGPQGPTGSQGATGPNAVSSNSNNYSYLGTDGYVYTPKSLQLIGQVNTSVGINGTTSETQFTGISIPIPANTFAVGDTFMVRSFYSVTGTSGNKTIQFRLGTQSSPTPVNSGVSCMSLVVANTVGAFQISRDNNKVFSASSMLAMNPQGLNDLSSTSGVVIYYGIDWTQQLYLYPTVTLVNAADRVTIQKIALFKY